MHGWGACKHGKRPHTGWWPGMRHLTGLVSVRQPLFIVRLEISLHRDITTPRPWVEGALSRVFMDRPSTESTCRNTRASHTFLLGVVICLGIWSNALFHLFEQGHSCLKQKCIAVVLVAQRVSLYESASALQWAVDGRRQPACILPHYVLHG